LTLSVTDPEWNRWDRRRWLTAPGRLPLAVPRRSRVCWWGRLNAGPSGYPLGGRSGAPWVPRRHRRRWRRRHRVRHHPL